MGPPSGTAQQRWLLTPRGLVARPQPRSLWAGPEPESAATLPPCAPHQHTLRFESMLRVHRHSWYSGVCHYSCWIHVRVRHTLHSGTGNVPVAMVPTEGSTIAMDKLKTIQANLEKASAHFRQITKVRLFGRGPILCCSPDQNCVNELLNCSTFASHPIQDSSVQNIQSAASVAQTTNVASMAPSAVIVSSGGMVNPVSTVLSPPSGVLPMPLTVATLGAQTLTAQLVAPTLKTAPPQAIRSNPTPVSLLQVPGGQQTLPLIWTLPRQMPPAASNVVNNATGDTLSK
ncbi:uncharacterized protein [Dermacentor albipictus]|uniref:uncharacterized protein isoform X2 n=1 Tax=Dermacentor albipictus TaxID=60249 RepID=UPI0038FD177C